MKSRNTLAIIGSGPSCIYLLKHLLTHVGYFRESLAQIDIFEKRQIAGMGMPYHPETTDRVNLCNISSEELPDLGISFADWLRGLPQERLEEFGIAPDEISNSEVYSRLALGGYLHARYQSIIAELSAAGISVCERANSTLVDVREKADGVALIDKHGEQLHYTRAVIATGHYWPEEDHPEFGYFASPWPIHKLLPPKGEFLNFPIGTLGASLSAFDVISSLAHRHGTFEKKGSGLVYHLDPAAKGFKLTMHAGNGLLPHLQYAQTRPIRKIERYVTKEKLLSLRNEQGFLRLDTYFDQVCRPVLIEAFQKDKLPEIVSLLENKEFGIVDLAEKMTEEHDYADAFDGMRSEMPEAVDSVARDRPIHWKEAVDDLMYTLNFYAELLPAEDHITLKSKILPFLMNVIAALPLPSALKLLALRDASILDLVTGKVTVDEKASGDGKTVVQVDDGKNTTECVYRLFVDCAGQSALELEDFPFPSLLNSGGIRAARATFANRSAANGLPEEKRKTVIEEEGTLYMPIGGIDLDRQYWLIGKDGKCSTRIADIAFPHASGVRPYSYGLQACNETARLLVAGWLEESEN